MDTIQIQDIDQAEKELFDLMQAEVHRWQRIAQLLITVKRRELYRNKAASFTAYIRQLAAKFKVHESNFWRTLKAGEYYLQLQGSEDITVIDQATTTPEKLELVEKINRHAPQEVREQLVLQATQTGLEEMDRQHLREIWQTYRPKKSATVELSQDPEGVSLERDQSSLSAQEIVASLRERDNVESLLGKLLHYRLFTEVAVRPGTSRQARRIDAVLLAQKFEHRRKYLLTVGIEIKVTLSDLQKDQKLTEYAGYCDQFYVAVPEDEQLINAAKNLVPDQLGILTIQRKVIGTGFTVQVVRGSHRQQIPGALAAELYGSLLPVTLNWKDKLKTEDE